MDTPLLSVASLHALVYCERLFYLEEVERIRIADASVYAGRRLHVELSDPDEEGTWQKPNLESDTLGIQGAVDVLRRRDGRLIPYEHKRGRSAGTPKQREAWRTDRIQIGAYAMLVEEAFGQTIAEARVRYHADNVTVLVAIDEGLRLEVKRAIARAQALSTTALRPPITDNEKLCARCSLAPVCLPEEARLGENADFQPIRLLPAHPDRTTIHVDEPGMRVGRKGEQLLIQPREGDSSSVPIVEVGSVVVHGFAQISTQALRLCADHDVSVHWMTGSGGLIGSLAPGASSAQRHLRQFEALRDEVTALGLARRLVQAKCDGQLRYLLRATRGLPRTEKVLESVAMLRQTLRRLTKAVDRNELLGHEGSGARAYFAALPDLISTTVDARLVFGGRSRRPPADRFNAALSFGYGMLYTRVLAAIVAVGLHPGVGIYHRPRLAAHTLALDLMELFRVPIVDMALVAACNRKEFDADVDFTEVPGGVSLSAAGRSKVIDIFERRLRDEWRHSVVGYSLSYARLVELEVRLLEKEWLGEGKLFARFRLR